MSLKLALVLFRNRQEKLKSENELWKNRKEKLLQNSIQRTIENHFPTTHVKFELKIIIPLTLRAHFTSTFAIYEQKIKIKLGVDVVYMLD